jgi:hypothetical protein
VTTAGFSHGKESGLVERGRFGSFVIPDVGSAADWISSGRNHTATVGALVPAGFEAYMRVFHPAYGPVEPGEQPTPSAPHYLPGDAPAGYERVTYLREVRWSEVAAANGRIAHAAMEWTSITGEFRFRRDGSQPGIWTLPPEIGYLPWRLASRLGEILCQHTATPDRCWFGAWFGYGDLPDALQSAPVAVGTRLVSGPISAVATVSFADDAGGGAFAPEDYRAPNLWWPEDHAWCLVSDVDLQTTYIGASQRCQIEILREATLEVWPASRAQGITWTADTLNPLPVRAWED